MEFNISQMRIQSDFSDRITIKILSTKIEEYLRSYSLSLEILALIKLKLHEQSLQRILLNNIGLWQTFLDFLFALIISKEPNMSIHSYNSLFGCYNQTQINLSLMYEQPNNDQSYISLSAFLCLDNKKQHQVSPLLSNPLIHLQSTIIDNPSTSEILFDLNSRSQLQVLDQENGESKSGGKQKKEKKEYSKNYRKKQKEYVENLRMMNEKYEKKIEQLNLKIDQMAHEIRCLKYGNKISDNLFDSTFIKQKQQTLKQLVNQAEHKKQTTWQQLKQFNFVYGFAGTEKINLLNYYMSQIIDHLLTDHNKNFVMNGLNDFEIATPFAKRLEDKEMQILQYSSSQTAQLRKFMKKLMPQTLKNFHKAGQQFYQSYVKLISATKQIENHFTRIQNGLFKLLSADQCLAVLKWYEENKHSKDIQQMRKQWFESFRKK